ncbi:hypothetical protein [Streptomyces sp. CB01881]|uniref:hypothetical protein n=1 Tax=Streptomyces sp. CB01881 TaxID=2078691 RepID=UPI000CDC072C|nr:hypothetical protein [Streptomyces sp. CB01881]AUY53569.1 hypothetical protein C2142_37290 [Streptomyces sp. CB01881]TYC69713.1 hypothetical protein EH183_37310 [Streptomyces sp. CB01881]
MHETSPEPLATFCGDCNCGCPHLFIDPHSPADRRVRITDDFGQQIQMSEDQFQDLVAQAKAGRLDRLGIA